MNEPWIKETTQGGMARKLLKTLTMLRIVLPSTYLLVLHILRWQRLPITVIHLADMAWINWPLIGHRIEACMYCCWIKSWTRDSAAPWYAPVVSFSGHSLWWSLGSKWCSPGGMSYFWWPGQGMQFRDCGVLCPNWSERYWRDEMGNYPFMSFMEEWWSKAWLCLCILATQGAWHVQTQCCSHSWIFHI